ncbi:hypothetical protein C8F04DRAFT_163383 [Mycena alexandri]|uniref:BTB domain-containing protein n=1 Tax=Mycena alexandri TaxID=1745969 RepID=A0AAD6SB52_9AGAR|nr:hypothetical protein C8F04DRAFT_163383 [Mycena alexandri]
MEVTSCDATSCLCQSAAFPMATPSVGQRRARSHSASSDDRPARRRRVDDPESEVLATDAPVAPLLRDPVFYKEEGDCYLRVETNLFKIHRYHLLRGGASVFKEMFMFPSGDAPTQGYNESDPIVLAGDSPERFRAFLTIAYAEPSEFQDAENQVDRLPAFIHCAYFAHKYEITPLFHAAVKAILHLLEPRPALTAELFASILALSNLCGDIRLPRAPADFKTSIRHAVEIAWVRNHPEEATFMALAEVLDISTAYGLGYLASLTASRYLFQMVSALPERTAAGATPPFADHPWLKGEHRLRILAGAWSMEQSWQRTVATAPAFPAGHNCAGPKHERFCVPAWQGIWRGVVTSPQLLAVSSADWLNRSLVLKNLFQERLKGTVCLAAAFAPETLATSLTDPLPHFMNVS